MDLGWLVAVVVALIGVADKLLVKRAERRAEPRTDYVGHSLEGLRALTSELRLEREELRGDVAELRTELGDAARELEAARLQIADARNEIQALRRQLAQAGFELAAYRAHYPPPPQLAHQQPFRETS